MRTFIRTILHFLTNWFFNSLAIYACCRWLPGMKLVQEPGVPSYLLVMELGLVLTVMNMALRPILLLLLLPLTGTTIGIFSAALNGLFVFGLDRFSPALEISDFWTGFAATFLIAFINIALQYFLPLDDDMIYFNILSQRSAARNSSKARSKGLVMLEIDGLSYPRLMQAIENRQMPFLKDLLKSGSFTIRSYDCGVPSQTSSCQAGIMYGRNENICAFRWYDKANRRVFSSSSPSDAADMEKMLFKNEKPSGILNNGMSINNIISGNASENVFTTSRMFSGRRKLLAKSDRDMYYISLRPYLFTKSLLLTFLDAGREVLLYGWDKLRGKKPRLNRLKGFYPIVRGATNILLRDISTAMITDAVAEGTEAIYTTFLGYDEVAHHSGPDSHEAYNTLGGIDRSIRKIYEAIQITNARPYELVILSDHGQSFGSTFKQRYGYSLADYIQQLAAKCARRAQQVVSVEGVEDNNANLVAVLNAFGGSEQKRFVRETTENLENAINLKEKDAIKSAEHDANDIIVLASGNLVNAYFQISDTRLSVDEIEEVYPGMIEEMITHPGIGTIFVHTEAGPAAFGKDGTRNLRTGQITGSDPLLMYGKPDLRAEQLLYLMDFSNVGDIVIISPVYEDGTVAAYEELIGSHGGLGGEQTTPFLMYSSAVNVIPEISNSREIFPVLKKIKNSPVRKKLPAKQVDTTSPKALLRQILDFKNWVFVLARTLFFSPAAYQEVAQNESFNGPALLIGFLTFLSNCFVMNRFFIINRANQWINVLIVLLINIIEILAAYITIILFRGKRHPMVLIRTVLFTNYFGLLWLFILTGQAVSVWVPGILLLRISTLAFSAITAGKMKRRFSLPVFVILVILIPALAAATLMIYNFVLYTSSGRFNI